MSTRAALRILDDATPAGPLAEEGCALVVGNFDGVHRGHQSVLTEAVEAARAAHLVPSVLTFDPHPAAVVGQGAPPMLTTLERRAELVGALGVERMYVRRFDAAFASWEPERFARELVAGALRARVVVVGQNFRFGAKRAGDLTLLRALGAQLGFEVRVHAIASDAQGPFSSTRAREAIAAGDLPAVEAVLGASARALRRRGPRRRARAHHQLPHGEHRPGRRDAPARRRLRGAGGRGGARRRSDARWLEA